MYIKRVQLTTVEDLIEELKKIPPNTNVCANGTNGYLHICSNVCSFDDDPLDYLNNETD